MKKFSAPHSILRNSLKKLTWSSRITHLLLTPNYFPSLQSLISRTRNQKVTIPTPQPPGDTAQYQAAQKMLRCVQVHICSSLLEWSEEEQRMLLRKNYQKIVGWLSSFVQACYCNPKVTAKGEEKRGRKGQFSCWWQLFPTGACHTTAGVCRSMKTTAQNQAENTATEQALSPTKAPRHPARCSAGARAKARSGSAWGCAPQPLVKGKAGSCTHLFARSALYAQVPSGGPVFPCSTVCSTSWF